MTTIRETHLTEDPDVNLRLNRETDLIVVCLGAVVFTLLLPWLLGAGALSSPDVQEHRREIERMSTEERRLLEANFAEYKESQPFLREEFRKLHAEIEANPELKRLLDEYCERVSELDVDQQEQIEKMPDPRKRLQLMARFVHEAAQQYPIAEPPVGDAMSREGWSRRARSIITFVNRGERLTEEEVGLILNRIDKELDLKTEWSSAEPIWKRGYLTIDELDKRWLRNRRNGIGENVKAFDDGLLNRVIAAVKTKKVAEQMQANRANPRQLLNGLRVLLIRSVSALLVQDLIRDVPPDVAREAVEGGAKDRLSPDEERDVAALVYRMTRGGQGYERELAALDKLLRKLNPRGGGLHDGPPGEFPPGEGGRRVPRGEQGPPGFPPPRAGDPNRPGRPPGRASRERSPPQGE